MMRLSAQAVKTKELKCVDHAREVGRRYRRIDKIVDQLILHRLTHIGGKQFIRVLIHQKQNLADPAELLYSICKALSRSLSFQMPCRMTSITNTLARQDRHRASVSSGFEER